MKVFIAGLGLIGASYASGLSKHYQVYGYDQDERTCNVALEKGYVKAIGLNHLSMCDVVILAFYPTVNIEFLKSHKDLFKSGQILTDVAGTKSFMMKEIEKIIGNDIDYCSHHPMAGKEKKGIDFSDDQIFKHANFIIVPSIKTKSKSQAFLKEMGDLLGFKKQSVIDMEKHDKLIGFTSQLPHAMAVALVNADDFEETQAFTGDSYRDLTRIAMINEDLWTELFFENKYYLLEEMDKFERAFDLIKDAIKREDKAALKALFIASTEKRGRFR